MPKVHPWAEVAADYTHTLVLGNGASIAFDDRLSYGSLKEEAESRALITEDVAAVFSTLKTTDFELVLRVLWHAQTVNAALEIEEERTEEAYESVRDALIDVVQSIHPRFSDVSDRLSRAARFMEQFETVLSLSYDVLVYWAILVGNSNAPNRFKDCFVRGEFQYDWQRFRAPYDPNSRSTLVFYPHGNVVISSDLAGNEHKVLAEDSRLLEAILDEWAQGESAPVFVSEGTTEQKRSSIRRSPYLSTVLEDVMPDPGPTIVLHGWALHDQDDHLLQALCRGRPERFAVGVDPGSSGLAEFCGRVESKLERRLGRGRFELVFYDRESEGCWLAS